MTGRAAANVDGADRYLEELGSRSNHRHADLVSLVVRLLFGLVPNQA